MSPATHNPLFASGRYFNHPSNEIPIDKPAGSVKHSYFNTGCCCFSDGDLTGIEIADGSIILLKRYDEENGGKRRVVEEIEFTKLTQSLKDVSCEM